MITTPDTPGNPGHNFTISATSVAFTGERATVSCTVSTTIGWRVSARRTLGRERRLDLRHHSRRRHQNAGTIFTLNKDGSNCSVLYRFSNSGPGGRSPSVGLLKASNGVFLGTTSNGGDFQNGTVFR